MTALAESLDRLLSDLRAFEAKLDAHLEAQR